MPSKKQHTRKRYHKKGGEDGDNKNALSGSQQNSMNSEDTYSMTAQDPNTSGTYSTGPMTESSTPTSNSYEEQQQEQGQTLSVPEPVPVTPGGFPTKIRIGKKDYLLYVKMDNEVVTVKRALAAEKKKKAAASKKRK